MNEAPHVRFHLRILLWTALGTFWASIAGAGAWTQPEGTLWLKVAGLYQFADEFYATAPGRLPDGTAVEPGDRRPFEDGGASKSRLVWSEVAYGITERLAVGAQVPFYSLQYEDVALITRSSGIGDVRLIGKFAILTDEHRVSLRTLWKLPTGSTSADPTRISVGDGQHDLEFRALYGRSLGRPLSWIGVEGAFRFRFEDTERDFRPGDERQWLVEAGWGLYGDGVVGLKGAYRGVRGGKSEFTTFPNGVELTNTYDLIELALMGDLGKVFLELGWSTFLSSSQSYPASDIWTLSFSRTLDVGSW